MNQFQALPRLNEHMEALVRAGEARLATVVASRGAEVEVLLSGGAVATYPTSIVGLPAGTHGVVIRAFGGSGIFIPTSIIMPMAVSASQFNPTQFSTTGIYEVTTIDQRQSFSGLIPGSQVHITFSGVFRLGTVSSGAQCEAGFRVDGASSYHGDWFPLESNMTLSSAVAGRVTVPASGVLTLWPILRWRAGTIWCNTTSWHATLFQG